MLSISKEKTKYHSYAIRFPFDTALLGYCRKLKEKYGWRNITFHIGAWRFNDLGIAFIIKQDHPSAVFSSEIVADMEKYSTDKAAETAQAASAAVIKEKKKSDLVIPGLKLPLYDYQKIGVEFFINNGGRAILADAAGVGKTAQAISYILYADVKKALVVCPASVKWSWAGEIEKWTDLKFSVLDSKHDQASVIKAVAESDIVIVNYDILSKFSEFFIRAGFELLVADESQYIKSPQSLRFKNIKKISEAIPKILLLSGTPMKSRPSELFTSLQLLKPYEWTDFRKYAERYCEGHSGPWGFDARGASNLDELSAKINHYFIRRTKDEVLPELPPKIFIDRPVDLNAEDRWKYNLAMDSLKEYLATVKKKNAEEIARSMSAEKLVILNELRMVSTMGKLDQAKEIIDEVVDGGEKILVFSCYNEPLKKLNEWYKDSSLLLTGQTDEDLRRMAIQQFQTDPNKKIFFGGYLSAGVGITLTAASSVLLLDFPWCPADTEQSINRLHRPGQTASSVTIYQMIARDTIDAQMREVLDKKQKVISKVMDNGLGAEAPVEVVDELFERISKIV
jgi:SWI/SNF-related matrix-associated actin-dependent regulator 1 of chromatin subfamily A